jgi:hypothetical protein
VEARPRRERVRTIERAERSRRMRAGSPNGKTVTFVTKAINKDLKVADNGDGTLTLVMLVTGNAVLYAYGKSIGSDTGQVRIELLIDDSGTPTDPFDDEVIVDLGVVKEPTGRNDDFCATVVPALI